MKLILVAAVFLVAKTQAWWFFDEPTTATADEMPIEESCIAAGQAGNCEFFNCFEQRLPCGRDFYMLRYGISYCNRFKSARNSFTGAGKEFLSRSQQCVTSRLIEYYRRNSVVCDDLEEAAIDMISPCYYDAGFCDVISDNTQQFLDVFDLSDVLTNANLWGELLGLARRCGGEAFSNFIRAASPFRRRR